MNDMYRKRNESRWKVPFTYYETVEEFVRQQRGDGAHSIKLGSQYLDFLVKYRAADTTLVVFSGALSLNAKHTPAFSGLKLAEDTGVNLIAVADPSMALGEITVAWYLGNQETGPLKPYLSQVLTHILASLDTDRTIFFGGSGGGYAAAHLANDFPDSIAFIFNPRLTMLGRANRALKRYFRVCHGVDNKGAMNATHRKLIEKFGPVSIRDLMQGPLNHDLLIYHNLLDSTFLANQLLPFLDELPNDPRLRLSFSIDGLGHVPIPSANVRNIIRTLAKDMPQADVLAEAGFRQVSTAMSDAFKLYPNVVESMRSVIQDQEKGLEDVRIELGQKERERLEFADAARRSRNKQIRFRKKNEGLEAKLEGQAQLIADLEYQIRMLESTPKR